METTRAQFLVLTDGVFSVWRRDATAKFGWSDTGLGEKPSAILAVLAVSDRPVDRLILCRLLWPEGGERAARNCLRQALFRIRGRLGRDSVIEVDGGLAVGVPGLRSDRDAATAADRQTLGPLVSARPRLVLVAGDAAESPSPGAWATRVEAFLSDPAAYLPRAAAPGPPPEPEPSPSRPRGRARGAVVGTARTAVAGLRPAPTSPGALAVDAPRSLKPSASAAARLVVLDPGPEPLPSAREAACRVVEQLWTVRGAVGVEPAYRITLERCQRGARVTMEALWTAIEDLLAAIVDEAPVVFHVAAPDRWPRPALRRLTAALERLRTSPLTLLGTGPQLPSSYDRSAPALDDLSPADAGRNAPRTARG